jgi:hypothetical protein
MKHAILTIGIICLMAFNVLAQENALKLNPLSIFAATGNVSYERAISSKQSFQLGVHYSGIKFSSIKYTGYGITPEFRFYLGQEVMNSFYVAPFARYQSFTIAEVETDSKATLTIMGGGVLLGRQWILGESFTIDLFMGPKYSSTNFKVSNGDVDDFKNAKKLFDGMGLRSGFTIGFTF